MIILTICQKMNNSHKKIVNSTIRKGCLVCDLPGLLITEYCLTEKQITMRKASLIRVFTLLVGFFFLLLGIWGLFSDVVFGRFTTNSFLAGIQIALGVASLISFAARSYKPFLKYLGIILTLIGVIWFWGGGSDLLMRLFNINRSMAYFNLILGLIVLVLALTLKTSKQHQENSVDIVF